MSRVVDDLGIMDPMEKKIRSEITELGLEPYAEELDERGLTVIPPEIACPEGLSDRLLDACLQIAENRNGFRPDLDKAVEHAPKNSDRYKGVLGSEEGDSPIGDLMQSILLEDETFEEALLNPVLLAIATYLCGYSSVLYSMGCFVKGPNLTELPLHADADGPSPLPLHATVVNLTYALTEFNRENGATAFVPGSHRWCRSPLGAETKVIDNPEVVSVECEAGSLVCWHGNTWHGAFNRLAGGLRVSIPLVIARPHVRTQENLINRVPGEVLARNSARFSILTQQGLYKGWANQEEAISGGERATRCQAAYAKELGVNPARHVGSLYA